MLTELPCVALKDTVWEDVDWIKKYKSYDVARLVEIRIMVLRVMRVS
jgi:hypothetical protein